MRKLIGLVTGALLSSTAFADLPVIPGYDNKPVSQNGFAFNASYASNAGDSMGTQSDELNAGSGFSVGFGYLHRINAPIPLYAEGNVGLMYEKADESSFRRYTLDAIASTRLARKLRVGFGLTHHISPTYSSDNEDNIEFDNATGSVVEVSYGFTRKLDIGMRYTDIEYGLGGLKINGSGVAIDLMARF